MGGNSRAIDVETGEVLAYAEKVDFRLVDRAHFCQTVVSALRVLNDLHEETYKEPIWRKKSFDALMQGAAFNGSSEHIFNDDMEDEEVLKYKPVMGDVDVTIPHNRLRTVFELLEGIKGGRWLPNADRSDFIVMNRFPIHTFGYLGQNKKEQSGHQINALFHYQWGKKYWERVNVQVDFEGSDYVDGLPTEFSKFAHSSSWEDIKLGLKGVGHKYWLTNLIRALSENTHLVQLTDKSPLPPNEVRVKKMADGESPRTHAFSVDRGLRQKLRVVMHDEKPWYHGGKIAVQEIPTSESQYVRDLTSVFRFAFGREPEGDDIRKMWSLTGLVDLSLAYVPTYKLENAYMFMLRENLFGIGAQKLDRLSKATDELAKMKIVNYLRKRIPSLKDFNPQLDQMRVEYYARY